MKKTFSTYLKLFVILVLAGWFVVKFSGPAFLRLYVVTGMGDCKKIPIFCMAPSESINNGPLDKGFIEDLVPYKFPKMTISMPKGFAVVQETVKKIYYKKKKRVFTDKVAYILYQPPHSFLDLFPQLARYGVSSDYEFIKRIMYANLNQIRNVNDTFFVIMKGVFIPDLGDQKKVKMLQFQMGTKSGFINYNTSNNFFDCNVIDGNLGFFKMYIKDKSASLNINDVLAIISTMSEVD